MKNPKRYTVTAALPYANGPLHIGHMAGVYIPADIYVRYLRARGRDVAFVCGSDEHGAAITLRAKKEGRTPQVLVDEYHQKIGGAFKDFGITFDIYHRTSSELHRKTAGDFFLKLHEQDVFEQKTSEQYFDPEAEQFLADRYITGTCPKCGHENAYGDQCEACGSTLSPQDLIDPRSTLSGAEPVLRETSHWFLPMQKHEDWLRTWLTEGKLDGVEHHDASAWKKQVIGQCKSWIDGGLQARAMTRDLDWGVPVPLEGADGKVLYVWMDAPIGYISATKALAESGGSDWTPYWQSGDTKLVHFLAKDNIVFHCIIFPILLKAHGDFILPDNVPANEFLNLEGKKISTSRNWAVWLHEYLEDFPGRRDELRYVLNAIAPEFRDSEFTWSDFQTRVNNELVAVLGNFVNRAIVLTHKFFDGKVPPLGDHDFGDSSAGRALTAIEELKESMPLQLEAYRFKEAQSEMMRLAQLGNRILTQEEPWKTVKTDRAHAAAVLHLCLQITANLGVFADPFIPDTAAKIREMLNLGELNWDSISPTLIAGGHPVTKATLLFSRVEDEDVAAQVEKLRKSAEPQPEPKTEPKTAHMPQKASVAFDDFMKIDIRIATILAAERVPKTDKLLKIDLDTGLDKRTVVSGIAEYYDPADLPGKQVSVLMNLEPRKIRGVESQGMILMAEDADGKLSFVNPDAGTGNGATVR
ncbi:MAG: methionine--tRNA ligase [Flavobacteriales bacterium]|nr:methionine--tRNA ligase [Flavobacteriales bacterium]